MGPAWSRLVFVDIGVITEAELEIRVSGDPGDPVFAELADLYRRRGDYQGAFDLCFNGLTANPDCVRGRIVLARLFYERLHFSFAARELREVCQALPGNVFARKLLQAISPGDAFSPPSPTIIPPPTMGDVLAEMELDLDSLDLSRKDP